MNVVQVEKSPLLALQRLVREKLTGPGSVRLNARNLADRLLFEADLMRGLFKLCTQLAIFVLLLIALKYTGDPSVQRGVYNNLSESRMHCHIPSAPCACVCTVDSECSPSPSSLTHRGDFTRICVRFRVSAGDQVDERF